MLRDRYDPMNLFDLVPALSMELDPVLTQLDHLLDDDTLFQAVKADLATRFPRTLIDGRPSTPIEAGAGAPVTRGSAGIGGICGAGPRLREH